MSLAHDSNDDSRPLLDIERQHAPPCNRLPTRQLATLCAIRLADPIAFTQIFPYVNEMMENFGVATNPSQTGFYSGIVVSVVERRKRNRSILTRIFCRKAYLLSPNCSQYTAGQAYLVRKLTKKPFTTAARENPPDKIGRRPVILAGALGISIASLCLGFSTTFSGVLLARCFGPQQFTHCLWDNVTDIPTFTVSWLVLWNGSRIALRPSRNHKFIKPSIHVSHFWTLLAPWCNRRVRIFTCSSHCLSAHFAYSPLIGGSLSNPAQKYAYFSNLNIFIVFPYLLPCLAVAGMTLLAVLVGYAFLTEVRSS